MLAITRRRFSDSGHRGVAAQHDQLCMLHLLCLETVDTAGAQAVFREG